MLALDGPPDRFGFRLLWSRWRRHHQAVAQRCHAARRARQQTPAVGWLPAPVVLARSPALTDAQWARVSRLLPPQRPPRGRPPADHRTILAGMLWIVRTGAAWRELPPAYGPWPTVYRRYRRWRHAGLWQRLLETLDSAQPVTPSEVSL